MKVVVIGRFRPPHNGSSQLLISSCERFDKVQIMIGSANRYDALNPFHMLDVATMIELLLKDYTNKISVGFLPDVGDGELWAKNVLWMMDNDVEAIISGNIYVRRLLLGKVALIHPYEVIPSKYVLSAHSSFVRYLMAMGNRKWCDYVPRVISTYIIEHHLDSDLWNRFGEEIRSSYNYADETLTGEIQKTKTI